MMARIATSYSELPFDITISACQHGCQCRAESVGDGSNDLDDEGYCQNWCRSRHYTCGHTKAHIDGIDCRGCNIKENDYGENVLYMKF